LYMTTTTGVTNQFRRRDYLLKKRGEKRGIREFVCQAQRDKYRIPI
jgi:hypothetical protein